MDLGWKAVAACVLTTAAVFLEGVALLVGTNPGACPILLGLGALFLAGWAVAEELLDRQFKRVSRLVKTTTSQAVERVEETSDSTVHRVAAQLADAATMEPPRRIR